MPFYEKTGPRMVRDKRGRDCSDLYSLETGVGAIRPGLINFFVKKNDSDGGAMF